MNYHGILPTAEAREFFYLFYILEVGRLTAVHSMPIKNGTECEIFLTPLPACEKLLPESFKSGLLQPWSAKFRETQLDYRDKGRRSIDLLV